MKKKVLILNPYLPTLGGGEKYMGYMCQFMETYFKEGVSIDILTFNYNDINVSDKDYVTIETLNAQYDLRLRKTKIRAINQNELEDGINFEKYLENITKEYDLFINFMIFSRLNSKAKKSIYLCMFPPVSYSMEARNSNLVEKIRARYKDYKFKNSYSHFAIISEYSKHWFFNFWGKVNSSLIYSPIFSEEDLNGRYDETKKKNIILSVGRFFVDAHSKKQLDMVRFFVNHQDIFKKYEYHLVGSISNYAADMEYLRQIQQLSQNVDNVFIHTNAAYEELINLYKQAKIFWHATGFGVDENLQPEKMEHFGITTVEAMSFGVVPVVIKKGGQRETVEDSINGFLWDTEEECIDKTNKLILDDKLRMTMASLSSERAKRFSVEEFYKRNREVFDELRI